MEKVAIYIIGDIVLSECPGSVLKKWRKLFNIQQTELAKYLNVSPSVISDYETGRRKNPGASFIRKYVLALIEIDKNKGGKTVKALKRMLEKSPSMRAILDMKEYPKPISLEEFVETIDGTLLTEGDAQIYGHTVIDSLKAIKELSGEEFYHLYGWTTERALIFTNVSSGRSPLVAIRVSPMKPRVIVLQGILKNRVDKLAIELAKIDKIPLVVTNLDIEELIKRLSEIE
ncbi:helix-turn-helix domain-containing protein [Methanocaldococcus infernus]|uniref:Transcriptional regulator, XRE family n=1 Tax=Methanocaldococcus infernus (strain DSM 11812 / JCM 15783 / ME) TaxID=573063 RepID=D5VUC2_METIM|nr:helix-turn-helix domain-containing protein [Methanocaldococcus infernus]ADG12734.1 transcriptional regulator, XRE family [Methanocaldococcus infernus ME]